MKTILAGASLLALGTTAAVAGGVERAVTSPAQLFEKGNYAELSFGSVSPSVSGTQVAPFILPAGGSSGDVADRFNLFSLGVKTAVNDRIDVAVVLDQPIGAGVDYSSPSYLYGVGPGSHAEIDSKALTAMLRYRLDGGFSVYGGLKLEEVSGKVSFFDGYRMSTSKETDLGYLLGVAYEKPEIALRVALTYLSDITHNFDANENGVVTQFETTVPQTVSLEFQSGIAKDTLVFGSVRWREWSNFDITPKLYEVIYGGEALVSYRKDSVTYTLGLGHKFTENWSAAMSYTHEGKRGGFSGNLGPTDGLDSLGLGVTYTKDNIKVTAGVSYSHLGNTMTRLPRTNAQFSDFRDNHAVGFGLKVGYAF